MAHVDTEGASVRRVALLGNHPPRQCGIATFTMDLGDALARECPAMDCLVLAMNDFGRRYAYPRRVRFEIAESDVPSYLRAADFLNVSDLDVLSLQHEYGIFGGKAGSHVLALLRELRMPIVTTLRELSEFLAGADVYITPYLDLEQSTSGTLAYALGSGRAIVSTPYSYARELLAGDSGILVPPRDAAAIARAVVDLFGDEAKRVGYCERAAAQSQQMLWPAIARRYAESFERASVEHAARRRTAFRARCGVVMQPDDKDAALLPRRVDGSFALLHRPTSDSGSHVWLSLSPDLKNWGHHRLILQARKGSWWDANKVGLSPPLIETPSGWLMIYHGVRNTAAGCLYRLGLALFALDDPGRCLLRGDEWIFGPMAPYECSGDVGNVVFPCGYTLGDDGDALNLYYGAADSSVALATGSVKELTSWLDSHGRQQPRHSASKAS